MKRRLSKLVLFLVLGAIVNVAVAWLCALTYWDMSYGETVYHTPEIAKDICMRYNPVASEVPVAMFEGYDEISLGHRSVIAVANSGLSNEVYANVVYAGWRSYSMRGIFRFANNAGDLRSIWLLPWEPKHNAIAIPLRPIWPGFAINTVCYAVIVWLLWSSPFAARRLVRRKRGHCIKCGYDLRGTSGGGGVCPECRHVTG